MAGKRKVVVMRNNREVTCRLQDLKKGERFKMFPFSREDKTVDGKTWHTALKDGYMSDNGGTVEIVKGGDDGNTG